MAKWNDVEAKKAGFLYEENVGLAIIPDHKVRWLSRKDTLALRDWLNEKIEPEKEHKQRERATLGLDASVGQAVREACNASFNPDEDYRLLVQRDDDA